MTSNHGRLQYLMYGFDLFGLNTPFMDPPFRLGVYPTIWAILPFLILSNNSGIGEVSTESKLFTVPCDGDAKLDCSCVPDDSSGNFSNYFSET